MSQNSFRPAFHAYTVKEREGKKSIYTSIGHAVEILEGKGLCIRLDALPLGDRILLFPPRPEKKPS